jgi:hypothetical protein
MTTQNTLRFKLTRWGTDGSEWIEEEGRESAVKKEELKRQVKLEYKEKTTA